MKNVIKTANELLQTRDYRVVAKLLNAIDLKDNQLVIKAMLYNHLVRDYDINQTQKDKVIERLFALYENNDISAFREDIVAEADYACNAFYEGENPYDEQG